MPRFQDSTFWSRVAVSDDCWLWTGALNPDGYGNLNRKGKYKKAHRYCYEQWHGVTLTPDQVVMYSCDNPACVNPAHLSVGTQLQNMRDCALRDRIGHGERAGQRKLTEQQVLDIRANYLLCRVSQKELARRYGVSAPTVHHIVHGRYWSRSLPGATGPATMG